LEKRHHLVSIKPCTPAGPSQQDHGVDQVCAGQPYQFADATQPNDWAKIRAREAANDICPLVRIRPPSVLLVQTLTRTAGYPEEMLPGLAGEN
jgi:hypothetical protein